MRLNIPVIKTFRFIKVEKEGFEDIRRMEDGEEFDPERCFKVTFRQGTRIEGEQRTGLLNQRQYKLDPIDGQMVQLDSRNPDDLAKLEIFTTLCDTDLEYPEVKTAKNGGEPEVTWKHLEFTTVGSVKRVSSRMQFERWWALFPDQWATELYDACLEVNPKWDLSKSQ